MACATKAVLRCELWARQAGRQVQPPSRQTGRHAGRPVRPFRSAPHKARQAGAERAIFSPSRVTQAAAFLTVVQL